VILCFDDGPSIFTQRILDAFLKTDTRALFGVIGQNVVGNEHLLERMVDEGHTIVNHSMTHPSFSELSKVQIARELLACQDVIEDACGYSPEFFRSPYVRRDPHILEVANALGFQPMLTPSVGDYDFTDAALLARECYGRDFVGLHELKITVKALPQILAYAKEPVAA
jgi:peptidoglycan/xylan/chitin deacetylase (PgdA/CDA1 family)